MTQEEFYIWLLNSNHGIEYVPDFNPEFLKNYEIAKLFLEKFGIEYLYKEEQKALNFKAVSNWFRVSLWIELEYDIPEILELLPERIVGYLDLEGSEIESLPILESVGGNLNLSHSQIQSLPKLESVGGEIFISDNKKTYWKNYFSGTGRSHLVEKLIIV